MFRLRDALGTLRTVQTVKVRDDANVLQQAVRIRIRDASNTLRDFFSDFFAFIPDTLFKNASGAAASGAVVSDSVSVTVVGGQAPIAYRWQRVSGSTGIGCSDVDNDTVTFAAAVTDGSPKIAVWRCRVTSRDDTEDAEIIYTENMTIELEWTDTR